MAERPEQSEQAETEGLGRREQKRRATRERLTRTAQRLFLERGFAHTTVDEIAAAAGVSRRTFFHYFASKEDVVFSRYDDFALTLSAEIRGAPPAPTVLQLAESVVSTILEQFLDPEETRILEQLKRDTPALRARDQGKYEWLERIIADALAERTGATPSDLRTRLDAILVAAVLRVAEEGWVDAVTSGVSARDHVRQVVSTLEACLAGA
jgi:AcrR family transcriptional regulator